MYADGGYTGMSWGRDTQCPMGCGTPYKDIPDTMSGRDVLVRLYLSLYLAELCTESSDDVHDVHFVHRDTPTCTDPNNINNLRIDRHKLHDFLTDVVSMGH